MKNNIIKTLLVVCLIAVGCTKSDYPLQSEVTQITTYELATTKKVEDINKLATATPEEYIDNDIIEAYVTSTDAGGTFYKSISFQSLQTSAKLPIIGFSVAVDQTMLFQKGFIPGRKVYIKLKGLAIAKVFGSMQIGVKDPKDNTKITGISGLLLDNFLFPSATIVDESTLVRNMSLADAIKDDANLNTLVEIDNVQFADNSLARTYFDIDSGGLATNHDLVDIKGGASTFCRISQFALFSANKVPAGSGSIRGILSKFNTDYQFIVRIEKDFKLNNPRKYNYFSTLNEDFSSYATPASYSNFEKYLDFSTQGTKKWVVKTGFLEMSSFGGNIEKNKAYFIVPVNMTTANTFKFDIKAGFYTGGLGLKVYRTSDYVPGMKISDATLFDITQSFNLPTATTPSFATSGVYNIPDNITGNGYFVFEYIGTNAPTGPPVTTTIDIDNIVIN